MYMRLRSLSSTSLVLFVALQLAAVDAAAQQPACTPVPDLQGNWRSAFMPSTVSDDSLARYLESERPRVRGLPDYFTPVASMSATQRDSARELVVWEDAAVMVLVNKPETLGHLLVIPKAPVNFITDLPPALRRRLAVVAAAAADAMLAAANVACTSSPFRIRISPPSGLGVRQLHVHVQPSSAVPVGSRDAFYADVGRRLGTP